jgi:hypothetical protein
MRRPVPDFLHNRSRQGYAALIFGDRPTDDGLADQAKP